MKKAINLILAAVFAIMLACSGSATPQDQLAQIDELMNKGFPITTDQRKSIDAFTSEGKMLLEQGKEKESSEALAKAIDVLMLAQDAYIFNKAD